MESTKMRRQDIALASLACIIVVVFSLAEAIAQPLDMSDRPTGELIQQLGSASFETREAATNELTRRGEAIVPQLEAALRDADLEIRLRARQLLAGMTHADLRRRLAAFVDDVQGQQQHNLPAWKEYQSRFGSDALNRKLFAEMVASETDLLFVYVSDKEKAAAMLSARMQAFENGLIPGLEYQASTASVATFVFLASDEKVPLTTSLGFQVYRFLNLSASRKAFEDKVYSPPVKKLLVSWIRRGMSDPSLARSGLLLAERYEMNEMALSLATQMLADKSTPSYCLPYAMLTIGRMGDGNQISIVQPLLANSHVCHTWDNGRLEKPIQIQVRDVALAVLVQLTKQDHKQYGFEFLRPDGNGFFYVYTLGFPADKQRDTALARWHTWLQTNK